MDESQDKIKNFTPYFEEIIRRLYIIAICFVIFFIAGFLLASPFIKLVTTLFDFESVILSANSPFHLVDLAMNIGVFFAVLLSVPLIIYHFYSFVGSGLRKGERRALILSLPLALLLFVIGFAYSFSILYFTMQTLADINESLGIMNLWDISLFLSQIITTSLFLGLIFQFPIVMAVLVKTSVIKAQFLQEKRRYLVFGMVVFTSLLPPTDGISLLLMVVPLLVLYELTILYAKWGTRQLTH